VATKQQELEAWTRLEAARYRSAGELDIKAEGPDGVGCLANAELDEPLFILRAKDPLAPMMVRIWAQVSHNSALHEAEKIEEALELAKQMETWRSARLPPIIWRQGL
jgi:hypothetical protein